MNRQQREAREIAEKQFRKEIQRNRRILKKELML